MKYVYFFARGQTDGGRDMKDLLGGKGANLAEMTRLGVPVPPGFTITTAVCRHHLIADHVPEGAREQVDESLHRLERLMGKRFGDPEDPLLISVRSGARVSMPGMMDTILEVGHDSFERILGRARKDAGVESDNELGAGELRDVVSRYKELIRSESEVPFPTRPEDQLWGAIEAVFHSWRNPRAQAYRNTYRIPHDLGTAVNVQTMVYGNGGSDSGTGVAFTRNAATGEPKLFGEFLINAQGEDVVAGIRDPLSIDQMEEYLPEAYGQLLETAARLERHYREMQDLEFTVEKGTLYLLQTRSGKRTARAAVRIAVDMANEGLITREQAVLRVEPERLEQVLHPMVDPAAEFTPLAVGNPASPGAASGRVVLTASEAVAEAPKGDPVILVRTETSPDDFEGMVAAVAIVTSRGGKSSHAAVVARGMGTCCVVGTRELEIDEDAGEIRARGKTVRRGEWITVDGASGEVIEGCIPTVKPEPGEDFHTLMGWVDEFRRLRVRTNADNPADAATARGFGAQGIGLCRTEHMFFGDERIDAVREMILAADAEGRATALGRLLPMQRTDFAGIFRAMDGLPVTIRLLDPPLHEFLPSDPQETERAGASRLPSRVLAPRDHGDAGQGDPGGRPRDGR
jgi:pyruvate,orthophosphate dikinase